MRDEADAEVARGHGYAANGELEAARLAYERAAAIDGTWSAPWFNIGLLHKQRNEWSEALRANQKALERDPANEGALWNLGIAATALGNWVVARQAWSDFGIQLPHGAGPFRMELGLTPIRVNPEHHPEVVWTQRIDPCRALIVSIPFRACGRRYGDLVLHDGAPNGTRELRGQKVPVFDELQVLEVSALDTFEAEVAFPDGALSVLRKLAQEAGGNVEDWTTDTRMLCRACSEGKPDSDPGHAHPSGAIADQQSAHRIALAARDRDHAGELLQAWQEQCAGIEVHWLDDGFATVEDD